MTTANPWFYGLLGLITIAVIAWPATVIFLSFHRPGRGRGETPRDRWAAGAMFRGDPRAVSRRDEMPPPGRIPPAGDPGPGDALPAEPAELAHRHRAEAKQEPRSQE